LVGWLVGWFVGQVVAIADVLGRGRWLCYVDGDVDVE